MNKKLYKDSWIELKNWELGQPKLIHYNKKSLRFFARARQRLVSAPVQLNEV